MLLPMLHNQLEKLTEESEPKASEEWRQMLKKEIEALEQDKERLLWQDSLPEVIALSLNPYKDQLEASYNLMTNLLEVTIEQR